MSSEQQMNQLWLAFAAPLRHHSGLYIDVGGALCLIVLALRIHVHNPMQR
jgi:hypothetical protein